MQHDYCRDLYALLCNRKLVIRQVVCDFPIAFRFRARAVEKSLCLTEVQQMVKAVRNDTRSF